MSSIKASIGRKVWLYTAKHSTRDVNVPFDATIIFVNKEVDKYGNEMVCLSYTNHHGTAGSLHNIPLYDPKDGDYHGHHDFATWMPYQVAVAKPQLPTTDSQASPPAQQTPQA